MSLESIFLPTLSFWFYSIPQFIKNCGIHLIKLLCSLYEQNVNDWDFLIPCYLHFQEYAYSSRGVFSKGNIVYTDKEKWEMFVKCNKHFLVINSPNFTQSWNFLASFPLASLDFCQLLPLHSFTCYRWHNSFSFFFKPLYSWHQVLGKMVVICMQKT